MLGKIIRILFSLPKTVYFNFVLFKPSVAFKLPIFIDYRVKLIELHSETVLINGAIKAGLIKIGWGDGSAGVMCNSLSFWIVKKGCKIIFEGRANFARGVTLRVDNHGQIVFGENLLANQNFFCASNTIIKFGNNVLIGWNVHIRDGNAIFDCNQVKINENRSILIGHHVWVASYASILKGSVIPDDCVVGYGSIVTKSFSEANSIIGGVPAVELKKAILWEK